ncbi:hypothetical protein BC936DRAFT_144093 [Jimgerdemannia flammicorona]|uniref:Uncharacterized protein n=2 Tax=Jimgerdemannia flammicorona TaxID=994334 RepID=A0A432ZY88_9FUNG|nr:hypothetical protein BC936DRAFT_144093 [Jimgerdemannia flammicorona]RUS25397.1 hypothetical protein BC938DRAFT_472231 [Jimgerdemannia flammicorona]
MDNQVILDSIKAGHAPANVAGGRRIKGPNHVPLKTKEEDKPEDEKTQQEQSSEDDQRIEKIYDKELERLRKQEAAQKLARDQEATQPKHTAWSLNNPKNNGKTSVGVQQPRQHNHMTYRFGNENKN